MKPKIEIITLYRYFAYAAIMRDHLRKEYNHEWYKEMKKDNSFLVSFFYSAPGLYLLYSYSGIYLVIEGWIELKPKRSKNRFIDCFSFC